MSRSETDLFMRAMRGVEPIRSEPRVVPSHRSGTSALAQRARRRAAEAGEEGLSLEAVEPVHPYDPIGFKRDGVQEGVYRNLRLGRYPADARLEVQGRDPESFRAELLDFLAQCLRFGIRTVIIHHGRGKHPQARGCQLKSCLNSWLPRIPEVMAFHSAQKQHGGLGATYVFLTKSEQARLDNREKHQKRRA